MLFVGVVARCGEAARFDGTVLSLGANWVLTGTVRARRSRSAAFFGAGPGRGGHVRGGAETKSAHLSIRRADR